MKKASINLKRINKLFVIKFKILKNHTKNKQKSLIRIGNKVKS